MNSLSVFFRSVVGFSVVVLLTALLVACGKAEPVAATPALNAPQVADLILKNGYVYTVDSQRSVAEALAIRDEKIIFVGSNEDVMAFVDTETDVRDLQGAMVLPGFHDMHIHALGTVPPEMCDLDSQTYSLDEMVPVLKQCIDTYQIPAGEFLIVLQWNFSEGNQPSEKLPNLRAALDAVSTEHPIFLWGNDGHHGAANSAAFALASNEQGQAIGLSAETLEGEFAEYRPMVAVDEHGRPSGGIHESARMLIRPDFFADFLGSNARAEDIMPQVAAVLAANGITSIQDAFVTPQVLESYDWLEQSGLMTFRLRAAMSEPPGGRVEDIDAHLEMLKTLRDQHAGSSLIEANAVKLFSDAVLEGDPLTAPPTLPVAAMLKPYQQPIFAGSMEDGSFDIVGYVDQDSEICQSVQAHPEAYSAKQAIQSFQQEQGYFPQQCIPYSGILEHSEEFLRSYIDKATAAGFHVHVHALADKAIRIVADEFAKVKVLADAQGLTQSIAHAQVVHPDDQKRIGELGIATVFTLVWTASGVEYEMTVAPFIDQVKGVADLYNPEHYYMQNVYPAHSIMEFGGPLVHGSDAPVGTRNPIPLVNLQMAITRGAGTDGMVALNPKEAIDVHQAIAALTINGAKLFKHDDKLGSIEVGKTADLAVLNRNIAQLAESGQAQRIGETAVTLTVFNGAIVYDNLAQAP